MIDHMLLAVSALMLSVCVFVSFSLMSHALLPYVSKQMRTRPVIFELESRIGCIVGVFGID